VGRRTDDERTVRPYRRPSVGVRALFGLLGIGVVLFNVALMLSDRAPGFLRRVFGDAVDRLSARIDADARLPAEQLPDSDAVVHIAVWAAAMLFVGLTVWTWRGLVIAAIAVLAISVFVEVGQGLYSTSRAVERSDVLANAVGVSVGAVATAMAYLLWSAGSVLFRRPQAQP